jgi:hypothetical protein
MYLGRYPSALFFRGLVKQTKVVRKSQHVLLKKMSNGSAPDLTFIWHLFLKNSHSGHYPRYFFKRVVNRPKVVEDNVLLEDVKFITGSALFL